MALERLLLAHEGFIYTAEYMKKSNLLDIEYLSLPSCDLEVWLSPDLLELMSTCWNKQNAEYAQYNAYKTCPSECLEADKMTGEDCNAEWNAAFTAEVNKWVSLLDSGTFPMTGPTAEYFFKNLNIIDELTGVDEIANNISEIADQSAVADAYRKIFADVDVFSNICYPAGITSAATALVRSGSAAAGMVMVAVGAMIAIV